MIRSARIACAPQNHMPCQIDYAVFDWLNRTSNWAISARAAGHDGWTVWEYELRRALGNRRFSPRMRPIGCVCPQCGRCDCPFSSTLAAHVWPARQAPSLSRSRSRRIASLTRLRMSRSSLLSDDGPLACSRCRISSALAASLASDRSRSTVSRSF